MKFPLCTIDNLLLRCEDVNNETMYLRARYKSKSPNKGWTGGCLSDGQCTVNVTAESSFKDYTRRWCQRNEMIYAVIVVYSEGYVNVTIQHIYRVPRMRPYLKVKTRLMERLKPSVLIVHPKSATSLCDLREAMSDTYDKYHFVTCAVPFRLNDTEGDADVQPYDKLYGYYIKTLQDYLTLRTWDLVCFLSGGSYKDGKPYYGILMNDKFVNFVSKLNYPSVCAVGHADEQRLFDMAFDDSLATPSLLGIRLKELYHHYYNNK